MTAVAILLVAYTSATSLPCEAFAAVPTKAEAEAPAEHDHGGHGHSGHGHHAETGSADPHGGHAPGRNHHASASADRAEHDHPCHEPDQLLPRCPCGCDEKGSSGAPGSRLGPGLIEEAALHAAKQPALMPPAYALTSPPPVDEAPDPIPI